MQLRDMKPGQRGVVKGFLPGMDFFEINVEKISNFR